MQPKTLAMVETQTIERPLKKLDSTMFVKGMIM